MNNTIRNIQLTAVLFVLASTIIAFFLEVKEMYDNKNIELADLLLMFIYISKKSNHPDLGKKKDFFTSPIISECIILS